MKKFNALTIFSVLSLVLCGLSSPAWAKSNKEKGKEIGEKVDHAEAKVKEKIDEAKEKGKEIVDDAKDKAEELHDKAKEKAHEIVDKS